MTRAIISLRVQRQQDVVLARQRARQIAAMLGFDVQDQTRLATAVSEIARNALQYAEGAVVEFSLDGDDNQTCLVTVRDRGQGIRELQAVLDGTFVSTSGRGRGISAVRRLMDHFDIESTAAGTRVTFGKRVPKPVLVSDVARIVEELAKRAPEDPFEEIREQNKELLRTLEELRLRQAELAHANQELQRRETAVSELNRELEDTNRGVVALYAELEEKAEFLGRASEMKSRFLSNMSHEFRTPLNSVAGLTRLLLDRTDGALTPEQEKQVNLIRRSTENLTELVNDLLDLAKVEAGKVVVRASEFDLSSLFGGLRGMLRPLLFANSSVQLIFDEPAGFPMFNTDESKVSQILRNFISNALKFTERGEIRVGAKLTGDDMAILSVADTGIGIAVEDQARIFEEFVQIEGTHQKRVKGTGLGLPLVKKLAELLGGRVTLESGLGQGSVFSAVLPRVYRGPPEVALVPEVSAKIDPSRRPVLIVEDNQETLFIYDKYLKGTSFQLVPARDLSAARRALAQVRPAAVVLDVLLDKENGWDFLVELKGAEQTRAIPVLVVTLVENEGKAIDLGAEGYCVKPVERAWLLQKLAALTCADEKPNLVIIIDDDEISRYLVREAVKTCAAGVVEAASGEEGIRLVRQNQPRLVILDFELPDQSGLQVLRTLRAAPDTARIPIIVNTSKILSNTEQEQLRQAGVLKILSKDGLSKDAGVLQLRTTLHQLGI
jgi:signal transduction histidine kinase/CheY-like chemotaxis protein